MTKDHIMSTYQDRNMILISHRGNLNGPSKEENHPEHIIKAVNAGFDVEIDVWVINNDYFLGHDEPRYKTNVDFLSNDRFWCHAKNADALCKMIEDSIHCFWHANDDASITSRGHIWCNPGKHFKNSIMVDFGAPRDLDPSEIKGICTDIPLLWKERYETILEE